MTSPQIVAAGGMRIDYLITRKGEARNGLIGGNAVYSAAGAALWSDSVGLWGRTGQNYPENWIAELSMLGLDTDGLVKVSGDQDHRTFYAYTSDGSRSDTNPHQHYARIGEPMPEALLGYSDSTPGQDDSTLFEALSIRPDDWPSSYNDVASVHLAPMPISSHMYLPRLLREKGVGFISLDPGERYMVPHLNTQIKQTLPLVDVFLPSKKEVASLFGGEIDMISAAQRFIEWGAKVVVIKAGKEGIYLLDNYLPEAKVYAPFHKTRDRRIVDVTGAGDAFCGGFLVGHNITGDYHSAILYGLVSSSLVLEGYGANYALGLARDKAYARLAYLRMASRPN